MVEIEAVIFTSVMFGLMGFLIGNAMGRHRFGKLAYMQGLYDGKVKRLLNFANWFSDSDDYRRLHKFLEE